MTSESISDGFTNNERNIRRTILPNGLTILTEKMEHLRSVAMGMWILAGSRHELPEVNGISHFVEHMVFKGTRSRTAQRIAREVDAIGGNLDAFTGKETICFNIKVLDEHVPVALDVLSDLIMNPVFSSDDIGRERGVILEEIKMDEDNPDYLVHEIFTQNFWKDHPLGKPILGTKETVRNFEQQTLFDYYGARFRGGNMIFSAAGNLEHDSFVEQVARHFESLNLGEPESAGAPPRTRSRIALRNKKSLEQVQLCLGVPSPPIAHEQRYVTLLLNSVLGGGMSSRLFQTIREERGLAYSIYSDLNPYRDTGSLCVYVGTSSAKALQVIDLIMVEFRRLKAEALPEDELRRAKDQLKGNILLSLESSMSRMSNLARQQMYFQNFSGLQDILDRIESVTQEQVMEMAKFIFQSESVAVTLLGRLDGLKVGRDQLVC
ncbi:MAG TPA: pitrilysin family protein [Acidisarcina sp.]